MAVAPTTERAELLRTVDSLTTGRGVDAIAQINPEVAPADTGAPTEPDGSSPGRSAGPGSFAPEIVVLLTDGANTRGVAPVEAAEIAASRGARVYPIGFGTRGPTTMVCTAEQLGGRGFDNFGPGGGPGGRNFLVADEATLRDVATATGGVYFAASDADQLQSVLAALLVLLTGWAAARWTSFPS